jgi:hypothetical protein
MQSTPAFCSGPLTKTLVFLSASGAIQGSKSCPYYTRLTETRKVIHFTAWVLSNIADGSIVGEQEV